MSLRKCYRAAVVVVVFVAVVESGGHGLHGFL